MTDLRDYLKVFLSHSWNDKNLAEKLFEQLNVFFRVWMDNRELRAGDRIQSVIDTSALPGIDVVVVLWSQNAASSKGVGLEIQRSLELQKRVIPCVTSFDANGSAAPPLPKALQDILCIDFRNPSRGTAELLEHLVHFRNQRLPAEVRPADEAPDVLSAMRRFLQYTGDRTKRSADYDREEWTSRAIDQMEQYIRAKNPALADTLLQALDRNESGDPALIELRRRLEGMRAQGPAGARPAPRAAAAGPPLQERLPSLGSRLAVDQLAARISRLAPPEAVAQWVTLVNEYVDGAPAVLRGLANHAQAMQSAAGLQVVSILHAYLQNRDDFVPDSLGKMGLLDDAWLILNTAFRLVESGIVPAQCVPLRWDVVAQVDHMVQALLPPPVLSALEGMIMQMLQLIAAEIQDYQPWFTPQAGSYRPVIATPTASGGCWEDQMNAALLGTGLSV